MRLILFAISHYVVLFLLAASSYMLGRRLTRKVRYLSVWEEISFAAALGLGVIAYLIFFLGLAGLLYRPVILAALILLQGACYPVWRDSLARLKSALKTWRPVTRTLSIPLLVIIALAPLWLLPLHPPTAFDSIMYHLPYAKIYAHNHGLVLTPFLRFQVFPQLNEMLFTLMLVCADDVEAQLVEFLMMGLVAMALSAWGRRVFSGWAGFWAALFWLSTRLVLLLGSSAYIDIGLTLFVTLAIYAIFNWLSERRSSWLVIGGLLTGFAAGSKYSALFFFGTLAIVILYVSVRERRWAGLMTFIAVAAGVAAPWYLRNLYLTGNPIFPFFPSLFGYSFWDANDLQGQLADWRLNGITGQSFPLNASLIAFPVFWLLPFGIVFGLRHPYIRGLLALALAFTLFWLFSASLPRYLLPVLPILSLATAASFERLALASSFLRQWAAWTPAVICISVLLLRPNWRYAAHEEYRKGVPVSQQERDTYLAGELVSYDAYRHLNSIRGDNYRVYALYDANMAYFADGTFMGDWFGPARYSQVLASLQSGRRLFETLRSLGADYFVVVTNQYPVTLPDDQFFRDHFKLVRAGPEMRLFELREEEASPE